MTTETAHEKIEEIEAIPEHDRTPQQKSALTRARNQLAKEEADAASHAEEQAAAAGEEIPSGVEGKLWWIQTQVGHVEKTGSVKFGNTRYKHMQEHGLLQVLKPLFRRAKVTFRPTRAIVTRDGNHTFAQIGYEFADIESGESIKLDYPSEGVDSQDKGTNKCLTNGMKYALQKFFLVPTEEIDDVEGSDEAHNTPSTASKSGPSPKAQELTALAMEKVASEGSDLTQQKVVAWLQGKHAVSRIDALSDAGLAEFEAFVKDA